MEITLVRPQHRAHTLLMQTAVLQEKTLKFENVRND